MYMSKTTFIWKGPHRAICSWPLASNTDVRSTILLLVDVWTKQSYY